MWTRMHTTIDVNWTLVNGKLKMYIITVLYTFRSVADDTITREDVGDIESTTTFEIVDTGSIRGKRKLVSSAGYSFVVKRQQKNGTTEWRCSVRGHKTGCNAVVRQNGDIFTESQHTHSHPAQPGVLSAVKVISDVSTIQLSVWYTCISYYRRLPLKLQSISNSSMYILSQKNTFETCKIAINYLIVPCISFDRRMQLKVLKLQINYLIEYKSHMRYGIFNYLIYWLLWYWIFKSVINCINYIVCFMYPISLQAKTNGKQNVFETANNLVRNATDEHLRAEQPAGARVSEQKLIRVVNRARATTRPKDPEDLTFEVIKCSKSV